MRQCIYGGHCDDKWTKTNSFSGNTYFRYANRVEIIIFRSIFMSSRPIRIHIVFLNSNKRKDLATYGCLPVLALFICQLRLQLIILHLYALLYTKHFLIYLIYVFLLLVYLIHPGGVAFCLCIVGSHKPLPYT